MTTDAIKISVHDEFKAGRSKASLAVQHDVSPRTIGRWIEDVIEGNVEYTVIPVEETVVEEVITTAAKDLRYIAAYDYKANGYTNAELALDYGVSESTIRRWLKKAEAELGPVSSEDAEETVSYSYVASSKSIAITKLVDGVATGSVSADRSTTGFEELLDTLISSQFSDESLADTFVALQPTLSLEKFSQGKVQIDPKERKIFYVADEDTVPYEVHNSLTSRVIDMVRNGDSGVSTLLNFLEKLLENPSRRAVNELYGFLEATDIEIAEDGDFYAWKKVRHDYLDIYTGTMDNSPGKSVRVARNMVDEDSNRTCSYGLHVCSKSYLPSFGNSYDSRILKVKVNPADVVAVPADYYNAKMRTAGYVVLEDVTHTGAYE